MAFATLIVSECPDELAFGASETFFEMLCYAEIAQKRCPKGFGVKTIRTRANSGMQVVSPEVSHRRTQGAALGELMSRRWRFADVASVELRNLRNLR